MEHSLSVETYFMFIDVQWPEEGIEQQFIGLHVYRWLSPPLWAHIPLRINKAPEARPWREGEGKERIDSSLKVLSEECSSSSSSVSSRSIQWPLTRVQQSVMTGSISTHRKYHRRSTTPPSWLLSLHVGWKTAESQFESSYNFYFLCLSRTVSRPTSQSVSQSIHCVHPSLSSAGEQLTSRWTALNVCGTKNCEFAKTKRQWNPAKKTTWRHTTNPSKSAKERQTRK